MPSNTKVTNRNSILFHVPAFIHCLSQIITSNYNALWPHISSSLYQSRLLLDNLSSVTFNLHSNILPSLTQLLSPATNTLLHYIIQPHVHLIKQHLRVQSYKQHCPDPLCYISFAAATMSALPYLCTFIPTPASPTIPSNSYH